MAYVSYVLTLDGTAQQLSAVLPSPPNPPYTTKVGGPDDVAIRQLILHADPANANAVFVGHSSAVSSSVFGFFVPSNADSKLPIILGPFETGPMRLSNFWVIGTNTQKLHIGVIPF